MTRPEERDETFDLLRDIPVEVSMEQVGAFVAAATLAPTAAFWFSKINLNTILMTSAGASIIAGSMYLLSPNDPGEPAQHQALPISPAMEEPMAEPEPAPLDAVPFTLTLKQENPPVAKEDAPQRTEPITTAPATPATPAPAPAPAMVPLSPMPPEEWSFAKNGNKKDFDLRGFERVTLLGSAEVVVEQGDFSVRAEGDNELLAQMVLTVSGNTLSISAPGSSCDRSPMDQLVVHVRMPALDLVTLNGSGDVIIQSFNVGGPMGMVLRGSGDIVAEALKGVSEMTVELTGSGDVVSDHTEVTGKTSITLLGSGDVRVGGRTETLEVTLRGSGDVAAEEMNANNCDVQVYGSGDVRVDCARTMRSKTMGSGDVNNTGGARGEGTRSEGNSSN